MPTVNITPLGVSELEALSLKARGLVGESWQAYVNPNSSVLVSQTVYATLVPLQAGVTATSIVFCVNTAGSGTVPTAFYGALYSTAGVRLAVTASSQSSTSLTTTGYQSLAFTAAYVVPTAGVYYAALLENGAFGTTALALIRTATAGVQGGAYGANVAPVVKQTGQATMPAPATFVAGDITFWMGIA